MARLLVIANKTWEADPLVTVLSSTRARPGAVSYTPRTDQRGLRGIATANKRDFEIWCLEQLLDPADASRSDKKADALSALLDPKNDVGLVIAFGTAATVGEESRNGCVVVGTNVFLHDPKSKNTKSHWAVPTPDTVLPSGFTPEMFHAVFADVAYRGVCEVNTIPAPVRPARLRTVLLNRDFVALATVNVTNYSDYAWADDATVSAYRAAAPGLQMGSIETTHGVIRSCTQAPFLFFSGITDRVGHFTDDVDTRTYPQNFVAAHNAGVALATALPALAGLF